MQLATVSREQIGAYFIDQYRGAARYVHRILRGEKPATNRVRAPVKFELLVNLNTTKGSASTCRPHCSPAPKRRSNEPLSLGLGRVELVGILEPTPRSSRAAPAPASRCRRNLLRR